MPITSRAALSDPAIGVLLIEFQARPETEKLEVDQILAEDPLIDRLRNLIRQMEQSPKAVAALVTESIGGLQLDIALACHVRFASIGTIRLDYPWLKYGLMPILGGTQRLPRLCGIELAARLLLEARKVSISEMAASGLFEVTDHPLPEAAVEWAEAHPKPVTTLGPCSPGALADLFSDVVESPTPREDLSETPAPRRSGGSGSRGYPPLSPRRT